MSTISCIEFQRLLDEVVESHGDPVGEKSLLNHAEECSGCGELLKRHRVLTCAVADWRAQVPQPDMVDAVLARMAFEQSPPRSGETVAARRAKMSSSAESVSRPSPASQAWASVTIAVVALAVAIWLLRSTPHAPQNSSNVATNVAATGSTTHPDSATTPDDAEVEALVQHAGSAYLVLANQTAEAIVEASRVVAPTRIALLDSEGNEGGTTEPASWGNDLKPIGREFGKALGFLFDAVPPEAPPSI